MYHNERQRGGACAALCRGRVTTEADALHGDSVLQCVGEHADESAVAEFAPKLVEITEKVPR